jgi:hypothetical protein
LTQKDRGSGLKVRALAGDKLVGIGNILFPLLDEEEDVPGVFVISRKTRKLLSARSRVRGKKGKRDESQDRPR